ncbi:MAG TPA: hypothetical protein VGQ11_11690, partial [Candidatus Acidoferrales bacterium]|nr:hypothetical protein [Candidatus Acidoferrales bacterium]
MVKLAAAEWVFWIGLGATLYTYVFYPLLLFVLAAVSQTLRDIIFLLTRRSRRGRVHRDFEPRVALLVAAYNEENVI